MPIRDVVIFPYMMTPFVVGRESSVRALEEAMAGDKKIFLATQHDASIDEPKPNEIYSVGTIVNIVQSLKLPDGNIKVLVEGVERGKIISVSEDEGYFRALVKTFNFKVDTGTQLEALVSRVTGLFEQYVKLSQNLNYETMIAAIRVDEPGKLADTVGANPVCGRWKRPWPATRKSFLPPSTMPLSTNPSPTKSTTSAPSSTSSRASSSRTAISKFWWKAWNAPK